MWCWSVSLCCLFFTFEAKEVVLSSGLQDWDREQLLTQYDLYQAYHDMGVITASSILVYNINQQGELDVYRTNDSVISAEGYQQSLKQDVGLRAFPCIYCDATVGFCAGLAKRLERTFANRAAFILNVTRRAEVFKWDAISVDFEPDSAINWRELSRLLVQLSEALSLVNVALHVWIGGPTRYDLDMFRDAPNLHAITMDTYVHMYVDFVTAAMTTLAQSHNASRLGFGLLSSAEMPEDDMLKTVLWTQVTKVPILSLWSDNPSGFALKALRLFLL
jgi:hypothetical protein